jgi:hypothetical protein
MIHILFIKETGTKNAEGHMGRRTVTLPKGKWKNVIWDNDFGKVEIDMEGEFYLDSYGCSILYQK